jgi:hypothetical protein
MKKLSFCFLILIAIIFSACDMILPAQPELSGVWKIQSLKANGEEYIDNKTLLIYAPNIAESKIVFGENNTFELLFVYSEPDGAPDSQELACEIHGGTYTFDGKVVEFNATKCENLAKEKSCQFKGEVDGNLLRISKSFAAGDLFMIPIFDKPAAINVIFKSEK